MPRYRSPVLQVLECAHTQSWWQLNFSSVKNICSVRNYFNNLWNGILRNSGFNSHLVPDQAGSRGSLSQMFSCFPNLNIPEQLGVFPATQNSLCWILQLKDWGSPTGTPMSYGWVPAWTTLPTRSSPSVFSAAPPRCHPLSACQLRLLLSISGLMQLWLLDIFTESNKYAGHWVQYRDTDSTRSALSTVLPKLSGVRAHKEDGTIFHDSTWLIRVYMAHMIKGA